MSKTPEVETPRRGDAKTKRRPRFNAKAAWDAIPAEDQARMGAAIVEQVLCFYGTGRAQTFREERPYQAAFDVIDNLLNEIILRHNPDIFSDDVLPLPSLVEPICRVCNCTEYDACVVDGEGCHWAEPDLCSACVGKDAPQ